MMVLGRSPDEAKPNCAADPIDIAAAVRLRTAQASLDVMNNIVD
jgi:hypothetical protein